VRCTLAKPKEREADSPPNTIFIFTCLLLSKSCPGTNTPQDLYAELRYMTQGILCDAKASCVRHVEDAQLFNQDDPITLDPDVGVVQGPTTSKDINPCLYFCFLPDLAAALSRSLLA
jgi:hypothetical protein